MGLLLNSYVGAQTKNSCDAKYITDSLACFMDTISWVEVEFQGELLKQNKRKLEKLLRLRLRNDLSMIRHDTAHFETVAEKHNWNDRDIELLRRGALYCRIWTVGDDYPVAFHINCRLWGYGDYKFKALSKFEYSFLGYNSKERLDDEIDKVLRDIVADIASQFLSAKDKTMSMMAK